MNPHNLENDELDYELSIRGISGLTNVDAKRRALRLRLKDEKSNPGERPNVTHDSDHLQLVAQDIMALESLLSVAVANKNHRIIGSLYSRLVHCRDRLSRIIPGDGNISVHQAYTNRMRDLMVIADKYSPQKSKTLEGTELLPLPTDVAGGSSTPDPERQRIPNPNLTSDHVSEVRANHSAPINHEQMFNIEEELRRATQLVEDLKLIAARNAPRPVRVPPVQVPVSISLDLTESSSEGDFADDEPVPRNPRRRFVEEVMARPSDQGRRGLPISKWSIKFSGESGLSLQDFFSQVGILSVAERASNDDLLRSAIYLFEGNAKTWYMASRLKMHTWEDLVRGLKEQFLPRDYDYWMMKDIENRYQKMGESFGLYLSHMEIMFQQLANPVPDAQKLAILMRNILPSYADRLALVDVVSLESLQRVCKRIEEAQYASSRRVLIPEPVVKSNPKPLVKVRVSEPVVPMSPLRCYNCSTQGHHFNDCPEPRGRFCFRCGKPDTVSYNCTNCNPGNQ